AALLGYLRLCEKKLHASRLMELASSLGADVPFFLQGGRALGVSKGDEIYPLPDVAKQHLLVVSPREIHVPTPDAYKWLNARSLYSAPNKAPNKAEDKAETRKALTKSPNTSTIWKFCA